MSGRQHSSLGDAVDVDFIANTRQFFEASDGSYVNLKTFCYACPTPAMNCLSHQHPLGLNNFSERALIT